MLHDSYHQKKTDTQAEKMRLIKMAAQLIKNYIKSIAQDKKVYPSRLDISNINIATEFYIGMYSGTQLFLYEKLLVAASGKMSVKYGSLWNISLTVQLPRPSWNYADGKPWGAS